MVMVEVYLLLLLLLLCNWLLVSRPSNMLVHLRELSASDNCTCCHTEIEVANLLSHPVTVC